MYTIVIAERSFIDLCEELRVFLEPLMLPDIVFCEWNRDGSNIDEMLPDLKKLIEFHNHWRAIIVNQDGSEKINPFDFTGYRDAFKGPAPHGNMEMILSRRDKRIESFEKATTNPLSRLAFALTGAPIFSYIIKDEAVLEDLLSGELDLRAYMLRVLLDKINSHETAGSLESFGRVQLMSFVPEEKIDDLITAVSERDVEYILGAVDPDLLPDFLSLISDDDPQYSDVDYNESLVENTVKSRILDSLAGSFTLNDVLPEEVLCFSPRTCEDSQLKSKLVEKTYDNFDYSNFAEYNLFSDSLKFLLYDIVSSDSNLYDADRMKMITFLLILAGNRLPPGGIESSKVYSFNLQTDDDAIKITFQDYLSRLKATSDLILETVRDLESRAAEPLDNETSRRLFESEIRVPVEITNYRQNDFYVSPEGLGLATDCPDEELAHWNGEYQAVEKEFLRFLREPWRALKAAVFGDFRKLNRIHDERVFRLNENQREDVEIKMLEEERNMVRTNTPGLLNEKSFKEQLRQADKEVKREISKRMTKATIFAFGGVALAVCFLDFLPLDFMTKQSAQNIIATLIMGAGTLAVMIAAGLCYLFVMRSRLKNKKKHFNFVIAGIFLQIESSLARFSEYLGHACNFMRGSSVLYTNDSDTDKKKRILFHHLNEVKEASDKAVEIFSKIIDCRRIVSSDADPYDHDYTVMANYEYPVPFRTDGCKIEYIQPGYCINLPTDFIVSISMNRVEIYD